MQRRNIDLEQKRIWIKQFKTGKEVLIPIAGPLLPVPQETRKWQVDSYVCPKRSPHVIRSRMKAAKKSVNLFHDAFEVIISPVI